MQAGKLRERVTVEERTQSQDSFGQAIDTWTEVLTDYAMVEQLAGREYFSDARVAADIDTRVTMRYRSEIVPAQRIVMGEKILDIQAVIADQKKTQLEIMCKQAA